MKFLAIVQARCGSTRFPSKILKDICGKPSLQRNIERIQTSKYIDETIIVTSYKKENIEVLKLGASLGLRTFMGSEDDVLDRFYQAAKLIKPEYVIRLTADCPLFDSTLLDMAIQSLSPNTHYLGAISETLADGLDFEILKFEALEQAWRNADLSYEREHVTQYILKRPQQFVLQDFLSPIGNFGHHRWTFDEAEDFELINNIYTHFTSQQIQNFTYQDILEYLSANPEIEQINKMHARNEGLAKSIEQSIIVNKGE